MDDNEEEQEQIPNLETKGGMETPSNSTDDEKKETQKNKETRIDNIKRKNQTKDMMKPHLNKL